jgi:hypothetical protein
MYHDAVPMNNDAVVLRMIDESDVSRLSGQDGTYLHIVHDRSCGAAGKGL